MKHLSVQSLREMEHGLRVGDMIYLPDAGFIPDGRCAKDISFIATPWFRAFIGDDAARYSWVTDEVIRIGSHLKRAYEDHRFEHKSEPPWIHEVSSEWRRYLRRSYLIEHATEPFAIVPFLPFAGISYIVEEGGLVEGVVRTFDLWRLHHIRQLGFLTDPVLGEQGLTGAIGMTFDQSRYLHSLHVMAVATLLGINAELDSRSLATLRVAAMSHDALTPAGGDTTKLVDPEAFDEDRHYPTLLAGDDWEHLQRCYDLNPVLLACTVGGEGLLGKLLDIADKIAYVGQDAFSYRGREALHAGPLPRLQGTILRGYHLVRGVLARHPDACAIWGDVEVVGETPVFRNAERLFRFLLLRAFLFRELYYAPAARFFEHFLVRILIRHFYEKGILTKEKLLGMADDELRWLLSEAFGGSHHSFWVGLRENPRVETFATREAMEAREQELAGGDALTLPDHLRRGTKTGAGFFVRRRGKPMPLHEAYPEFTNALDCVFASIPPYLSYIISFDELPKTPEFGESLASYREYRARLRTQ